MISNREVWQRWEAEQHRQPADYHRNLEIFEAMYQYARRVNPAALTDPGEGLASKVEFARALNVRATA